MKLKVFNYIKEKGDVSLEELREHFTPIGDNWRQQIRNMRRTRMIAYDHETKMYSVYPEKKVYDITKKPSYPRLSERETLGEIFTTPMREGAMDYRNIPSLINGKRVARRFV